MYNNAVALVNMKDNMYMIQIVYVFDHVRIFQMLPCLHTFDTACLKSLKESDESIKCPDCGKVFHSNVDDLPKNIWISQLLNVVKTEEYNLEELGNYQHSHNLT